MSAGVKKGRNRLSLILQLGSSPSKSSDPVATKSRSASNETPSAVASPTSPLSASRTASASTVTSTPLSSPPIISPTASPSPARPTNVNQLGAQEKTRLLKKARKLSQILGEMPITETKHADAYESQPEDSDTWGRKAARRLSRNTSLSIVPLRGSRATSPLASKARPALLTIPPPMPQRPSAIPSLPSVQDLPTPLPGGKDSLESIRAPDTVLPDVLVSLARSSVDSRVGRPANRSPAHLPQPESNTPSGAQVPAQGSRARLTRSSSARAPRSRSRRSMETSASSPAAAGPRPSSSSRPSAETRKRPLTPATQEHALRKSRSMWARKGRKLGEPDEEPDLRDRDAVIKDLKENSHFGDSQRMSKTQRAQSVKRARKLNQMFGSEPPQALYQISTVVEHSNRDSVATFLSISSADLLSVHTSKAGKHHSFSSISISSISSEPSSPVAASTPAPEPPRVHRRAPSTPPPFQDLTFSADGHSEEPERQSRTSLPADGDDPTAFRQRRMRAAKLSRFFGVDMHDIVPSLEGAPPVPRLPAALQGRVSQTQSVDVRIQESGKFWSRQDEREPDMNDVISRLREMR